MFLLAIPQRCSLPPLPRSPAPLPTSILSPLQLQVFEALWLTVRQEYLYADFNGLDWDAVHEEYRQQIEAGLSSQDFYAAMSEMIYRLGDKHSHYLSPEEVAEQEAEFAGEHQFVGIGVLTVSVPERKRVTIILVYPGSPAEEAGLLPHDSILAVEGLPVLEEDADRRSLITGMDGTLVLLTVQTPGQEPRELTLIRRSVQASIPVPYSLLNSPGGKRIGYIFLATFIDETLDLRIRDALEALAREGPLDGLILDNRQNNGGVSTVARATLGFFTRGIVGHFLNRDGERSFNIFSEDVNGSQRLPLVVLVGPNTASFGEIVSGILQDVGRAAVIGEQTEGNVEILYGYDFEDGSLAWLAHDTFRPLKDPGQNWEESGIIPDIHVTSNWDEVTLETDPVIQTALDHLDKEDTTHFRPEGQDVSR